MILFVLKPSIFFSVLHDCVTVTVTCVTITYDITSHFYLSSKIKKNKIKPSFLFTILTA